MHFRKVLRLLAYILIFLSVIMIIPAAIGYLEHEYKATISFVVSAIIMVVCSIGFLILTHGESLSELSQKDGFMFTTVSWILATAFGALPLVLSGDFSSYSDAFFEIMSGFTTTGATSLTNIECCNRSILFWRSMTNWLGGMGIVVLFVALLPALGAGAASFSLLGAESVGPVKGKLTPKTKSTAMALWIIYIGLTALQTCLLMVGGLDWYDAVTVSFSTLSAAGFCVKNASIGAFGSAYVEIVTTAFMLMAGINFALYYKAFTGHLKSFFKDTEMRWFISIFAIFTVIGALVLYFTNTYQLEDSFRIMAFQTASILTTTGFTTANYLNWPTFAVMLLILTMFIGGSAGSAGGGIKVVRISTILKAGIVNIKKKIHPNSVYLISDSNGPVENETVLSIFSFVTTYIATWLIGTAILSISGQDILTCMSSTLLTLGNIGVGFAETGIVQSFSVFPAWAMWLFSFLMLVGRLELFTVYVLFSKAFYRD